MEVYSHTLCQVVLAKKVKPEFGQASRSVLSNRSFCGHGNVCTPLSNMIAPRSVWYAAES